MSELSNPIGFRVRVTDQALASQQGKIVIATRLVPHNAGGSFSFSSDPGLNPSTDPNTNTSPLAPDPVAASATASIGSFSCSRRTRRSRLALVTEFNA